MRQIILDTETTGLEVQRDHRVVEIGCLELVQRQLTGRQFHHYLNPERAIDAGARAITGITDESLLDKPRFAEIAEDFLAFIDGAELIAHNAAFDIGFLDAEFARAGYGERVLSTRVTVLDTLALAREKFPGQRNSLSALCRRLDVDDSHRELHGAMLDANLLVEVYLALTAGQGQLGFGDEAVAADSEAATQIRISARPRILRARDAEIAAHLARLQAIEKKSREGCVWLRMEGQDA